MTAGTLPAENFPGWQARQNGITEAGGLCGLSKRENLSAGMERRSSNGYLS